MDNMIGLPLKKDCLPGRSSTMPIRNRHFVNGNTLVPPFPESTQVIYFGMGCFWGAERRFWQQQGVYSTAVGFIGGYTLNPTYQEVCSGLTAHNEAVLVAFEPTVVNLQSLLNCFWESHNPTQGMRQGNDTGTQYRSGIYCTSEQQLQTAQSSAEHYQKRLHAQKLGDITTEILLAPPFYYAEDYHQQYLAKNPAGYCGLGGLGISYDVAT